MPERRESTDLVVGPFDMLHIGHVRLLQVAARAGARLIVGVLDDQLFEQLLGSGPFMPDRERVDLVAELSVVDRAILVTSTDLRDVIDEYAVSGVLVDPTLSAVPFAAGAVAPRMLPQPPASTSELLRAALTSRVPAGAESLTGARA